MPFKETNNKRHVLFSTLDLFIALLTFTLVNGLYYLNNDNVATLPFCYKPLINDICYASGQSIIYGVSGNIINILENILPVSIVHCFFILTSLSVLLYAIKKIIKSISQYNILFAFLVVPFLGYYYNNLHFMAGFLLPCNQYASHFLAITFSMLAISLFIAKGKVTVYSILLDVLAIVFHVRVGVFGVSLLILIYLFFNKIRCRYYVLILCTLFVLLITSYMDYIYSNASFLNEMVRILAFFRNPYHYLPQVFQKYIFINLLMIFLFFLYVFFIEIKYRFVIVPIFICYIGVLINVINNLYMFSPFIALSEMYQFGPFILIFFYILLFCFVCNKFTDKYYLSSLAIIFAPTLQIRLFFLFILIMTDHIITKRFFVLRKIKIEDILSFCFQAILFSLIYSGHIKSEYLMGVNDLFSTWLFILSAVVLIPIVFTNCRKDKLRFYIPFILIISVLIVLSVTERTHRFQKHYIWHTDLKQDEWYDICKYCKENTLLNSCFIIPPNKDSFQFLSKRAAFFSLKSVPLNKNIIKWADRAKDLGIIPGNIAFSDLNHNVNGYINFYNYQTLPSEQINIIARRYLFVKYIISSNKNLDFPSIYSNQVYTLYSLKKEDLSKYQNKKIAAYTDIQNEFKNTNLLDIDRLSEIITTTPSVIHLLTNGEKAKLAQLAEIDRVKSNIVINPGAEEGNEKPIGWKTKAQLLNESTGWATDVVHTGIHSLKINNNGQRNIYWAGEKIKINKPLKSFRISAWAYIDRGNEFAPKIGKIYLVVKFKLENESELINKFVNFDIDKRDQWQHKTIDVEFDKNVEEITPYVCANSNVGIVWFDDIEISPLKEIYSLL